jgi:hypothetical protein
MDDARRDLSEELVLDGNAVAGELHEVFGFDLTPTRGRCAHCGNVAAVATLRAYVHGPGTVLRCSVCREVVLRFALTPAGVHIDLRGAAYLQLTVTR